MNVINPKKKDNLSAELKFRTTRVRVFAWMGKDPNPVVGYAFVSDIKKKAVAVYFPRKFPVADMVLVAFENDKAKPFPAKVTGNKSLADEKHGLGKEENFNWKTSFVLEFVSEDEAKLYLDFFSELRARISTFARDVKQQNYNIKEGSADDGLGDLDLENLVNNDKKGAA